jgi:predicted DNA-binding antitoxin AbrB/MazE fold protein
VLEDLEVYFMDIELKVTYNHGTFHLDEPLKLTEGQQYTIVVKEIKAIVIEATNGTAEAPQTGKDSYITNSDVNWQPPTVLTGTGTDLPPSVSSNHREMYEVLSKPVALKIAPQRKLDNPPDFEGDIVDFLQSIAGKWEGPEDWSEEHDHYLYGTPKHKHKD